jgi:hypothetical protein
MKYMMMMSATKAGMAKGIATWPKQDIQAHIAYMMELNKEMKESGEFVEANGLAWPDQAKMIRAAADGTPITDGVFPESKEFLAGFWIVDVEGEERAYALAARASSAPGPGGKPLNMPIELRQVMCAPPEEYQG